MNVPTFAENIRARFRPPSLRTLRSVPLALGILCGVAGGTAGFLAGRAMASPADATRAADGERPVIGIEYEGPIRVVYQVSADQTKNGVGKGLLYLKKLHESYVQSGVDPSRLNIRAVFHGEAADHTLTDEAWNRHRHESGGNPNTALLGELAQRGVHVELCDTRRVANGWSKADVHPEVLLVKGAFQRIIDLQHRGYAYIRF